MGKPGFQPVLCWLHSLIFLLLPESFFLLVAGITCYRPIRINDNTINTLTWHFKYASGCECSLNSVVRYVSLECEEHYIESQKWQILTLPAPVLTVTGASSLPLVIATAWGEETIEGPAPVSSGPF